MGVKDSLGDNKKILLLSFGLLALVAAMSFAMKSGLYSPSGILVSKQTYTQPEQVMLEDTDYDITIKTVYGNFDIELYEDKAPESVNSFLFLIGQRYYNDLTFHKVIKNFVIQAGDTKGNGTGNPGYYIPKENLTKFDYYDVGMANASQFFIVLPDADLSAFNGEYTLIGEVVKGFDVVDSIGKVSVDDNYKPINDVTINSVLITEN